MAQSPQERTTGDLWNFEESFIDLRGPPNVPTRFLKNARWENYKGVLGYYASSSALNQGLTAVEFDYDHLCWAEVRYR